MINKKNGLIIVLIMFLGKILGFIRDIFISNAYGISYVADAYNISYILTITIFGVIGAGITNSMVTTLSKLYNERNNEKLFDFLNKILNVMILIAIIVVCICSCFSNEIVKIIGGNLEKETFALSVDLIKISLVSIIFLTINSILNAALRIFGYYKVPIVASSILNLPSILYLTLFNYSGVKGLTYALVIGYIIQCIVQIPFLFKKGFRYKFIFNINDENLKDVFKFIPNMILTSGILQISIIFDNRMASELGNGYISSLAIASKVNALLYTVFASSIIQIAYTQMAKSYRENGINDVRKILSGYINKILIIIVPLSISTIFLSKEIISVLFLRGNFDRKAVEISSEALIFYSIGLIFYILRDIFNYYFYSIGMKNTPIKVGIYSIIVNITLNIILTPLMGIAGIGLATTIGALSAVILLKRNLNKKIENIKIIYIKDLKKIITSTTIIIINIILYKNLFHFNYINFFILIIICIIEYFALLVILRHSEFEEKIFRVKEKL